MAEVTQWQLAGAIEAVRDRVPIENLSSDALAKRLLAALPTGSRLADADLCASCGNQFPDGHLCDPCKRAADGEVVDAHICCEHVPRDGELSVLAVVKGELDRLALKPEGTVRRVLAYLADAYGYVLADED